jgi:hypothetical protein
VPDECDPDCNSNREPDECDLISGASEDCNGNDTPDECDVTPLEFAWPTYYPLPGGGGPSTLVTADFDRDGAVDAAASSGRGQTVSIYLNQGNGQLGPRTDHTTPQWPGVLAVGDLNGDDAPDLVVSTTSGAGPVAVLLNNGDGTFPGETEDYSVADRSHSVTLADLDDDEDLDVAAACYYLSNTPGKLSVMFNNGDGTFIVPASGYQLGLSPTSLTAGDLDGDELPDVAVVNSGDDNVAVCINAGGGTFLPPVPYTVGDTPMHVAACDLELDGDLDLVVANYSDNSISLLFNNGDGTFGLPLRHAVGLSPTWTAFGDLDGDLLPDLAVANRSSDEVSLLLNKGSGAFSLAASVVTADWPLGGSDPYCVTLAYMDADDALDLVLTASDAVEMEVLLNESGPATSADGNENGIPDECEGPVCTCGDFNGDGLANLVDFSTFAVCFGFDAPTSSCPADVWTCTDLNADGVVNLVDFSTFSVLFATTSTNTPPNCL